jgi:hypothetical protein
MFWSVIHTSVSPFNFKLMQKIISWRQLSYRVKRLQEFIRERLIQLKCNMQPLKETERYHKSHNLHNLISLT